MGPVERRTSAPACRAVPADLLARLDLPHVVHVYDRLLGEHSVIGPFDDPVLACCYADRFRAEVLPADADPTVLEIVVVPLEPAPSAPRRATGRRR